jgi:hypothetical protein
LVRFIRDNADLSDVLHYDARTRLLSAEDPKFLYYLRNLSWNAFARQVGFTSIHFTSRYNFALSFAGTDRDVAYRLFQLLQQAECEVFYDTNEQHRIAAANIEDYLGPIYRSEARFVVAILGVDYPTRIWTKFESEQFGDRFGDGSVIPIWDIERPPSFYDQTQNIGGYTFNKADINLQLHLEHIAQALLTKSFTKKSQVARLMMRSNRR